MASPAADNALIVGIWLAAACAAVLAIGGFACALAIYADAAALAWMTIGGGIVWSAGWVRRQREIERRLVDDADADRS